MYVLCGELWSAALGGPRVSMCACSVTNNDIVVACGEISLTQCGTFPGIGPEAESNHVTLRIKYGKIPLPLCGVCLLRGCRWFIL